MADQPIPREQWGEFCGAFGRQHHGWLVSVRRLNTQQFLYGETRAAAQERILVRDQPLQQLREKRKDDTVALELAVGEGDEATSVLVEDVSSLYRLRVDEAHKGVRIDSHDGTTTLIEFRAAAQPETLDGLAESEFSPVPDQTTNNKTPGENEDSLNSFDVTVQAGEARLDGIRSIPPDPRGIVVFVHGSGSSRFSSRNRYVAGVLNKSGLATLLFDLLTAAEDEIDQRTRELRFNIDLLSERTTATVDWLGHQERVRDLPLGLFGASTGAAAALNAAAARPQRVGAVVSRGGRPDLAPEALPRVTAPTLLIVGGDDLAVIEMNRSAAERLAAPHELSIVPGATHLFEEPGKLEQVASLARDWFLRHLSA